MKKSLILISLIVFNLAKGSAQESNSISSNDWDLGVDLNLYLIKDNNLFMPVIRVDNDKLHLEGRYNYEDYQTLSFWGGYNFSGGKKVEYFLTPMLGTVFGNTMGVALGFEMTFDFKCFEFYSESEYLVDMLGEENNYFYTWSNLSYYPVDWLWVGVSGQRTKLYHSELEIQLGFQLGAAWRNWELNTFFFNPGYDDFFWVMTLSFNLGN